MLSKNNRLRKDKDFEKVFKEGKFFSENFLSCKFTKNNLEASRFGFLVGVKVSKKAVDRNKVKRRLRAIVRNLISSFKPSFDIVIMVRPVIKEKTFSEIQETLKKLFIKSQLLN